jgi:hypothetical protein
LDAKRWDPTKPGGDAERFRSKWFEEDRPSELMAASVFRQDGTRFFTAADAKRLKGVNPKSYARLLTAVQEVNGEDANELKLSGKAESPTSSGDSGSELPMPTDIGAFVASSKV